MLDLCRSVAEGVWEAVNHLVGKGDEEKIDAAAEKAAYDILNDSGISMLLVSEESGVTLLGSDPEYICLLDPLDGTYNAAVGIPVYAVSIAFSPYREGAVLEDLRYAYVENLHSREGYSAVLGKGAAKDGEAIRASVGEDIETGTYCVYLYGAQLSRLAPALERFHKIRILGCASLELCMVAEGVYSGLIDLRGCIRNIDVGAGTLIVEEAGGRVSVRGGGEGGAVGILDVKTLSLVAGGNDYIHRELTRLLGV
jgi:myo-inositol-1(or 4)-monophosphatase